MFNQLVIDSDELFYSTKNILMKKTSHKHNKQALVLLYKVLDRLDLINKVLEDQVIETKEMLTLEDASSVLGCSLNSMYSYIKQKLIPYYQPTGRRIYVKRSEILLWVYKHKVNSIEEIRKEANLHLENLKSRKNG